MVDLQYDQIWHMKQFGLACLVEDKRVVPALCGFTSFSEFPSVLLDIASVVQIASEGWTS